MRRVLIVAYYFPPIAGIGSIRLASFARYLPEFGWEPTVLAPRNTPHPQDPSLQVSASSVVRSSSLEPGRMARTLPGSAVRHEKRSITGGARATAKRLLYPDAQIGWYPGAVASGRSTLRRQSFDAVFSSSFPITAHLVARMLSRRSGLPWVSEFRDPWSATLPADSPHRRWAARLEAQIAHEASRVIMPTPTWAAHFGKAWNVDVALVRNGHELDGNPTSTPPPTPTLTHLGSFYPGRQSLAPLWRALRRMEKNGRQLPRVRFIGDVHPEVLADADRAGIGRQIEATGQVPHDEAMRLLTSSSMLFASGQAGDDPVARGWIPAKLYEYLASGLPILYLGDPKGDAGALLREHPGTEVIDPADIDAILPALEAGIAAKRQPRISNFSRRVAAEKLARVLDQAAATGTPR